MIPIRYLILFFVVLLSSEMSYAQYVEDEDRPKTTLNNKTYNASQSKQSPWMFGGNFFVSFGNIRSFMLTPRVGYWLSDHFLVGGNYTYIYHRFTGGPEMNVHGPGVHAMYVIPNPLTDVLPADLLINGEFDYLWAREGDFNWEVPQLMLGPSAFFRQGRGGFMVGFLYNVLYDPNRSIFASPWQYRVGVLF
ncbi:MAG: hypothetical protein LAT54_06495 [Cryomorphaceae bacterium]|nr:hypothetical protein [Cryomorphaceae bacterium]